jgi:hypothetical protein
MSLFQYFFYCICGRFFAWGVQKHQKMFVEKFTKILKKAPTHFRGHFFSVPLALGFEIVMRAAK